MAKRTSSSALLGALAICAAAEACEAAHQGAAQGTSGSTGTGGGGHGAGGSSNIHMDGGTDGPPALDAGGYCGNQIHQVITDAPNLDFVFDISGSMNDPGGGGFTKYQLVENGAVQMIQALGPLINVGAAVFPFGATAADPCHVGAQVFPVSPGDPIGPMNGPTLSGFIQATSVKPAGGTPTAATLAALQPGLLKLKGKTVVLLATDGGPNCNPALSCGVDQCVPNLEGMCKPLGSNCCAPGALAGPTGCLDHDASVAAVASLAKAGIPVVVIGITGSDLYASVLDDMAVAGGVPQPGSPSYFRVDDLTLLEQVFQSIAGKYVSCDFVLANPPPSEGQTNVYFDKKVVPADKVNGWIWKTPSEIELVGAACAELKAGKVKQVQVVSGCPTQQPT